jgi:rare lipoprotein A
MLTTKIQALGSATRFRMALAFFAALALMGGSVSEASARTHHRHYSHHRHYHHHASRADSSWRDANASIPSSGTGGRTFAGVASFYGNESGSKTASGQRFNQNAMTCAHRSLPFGTRLRVTHGDRSVVVTVNDRGPFIRGRVLDLSTAAARAVGITSSGVGHIVAEVL